MSILLENVGTRGKFPGAKRSLFDGLSLRIDEGGRIGILGGPKSGKSTLLRLICGTQIPENGAIRRDSSVSWPIPHVAVFLKTQTLAQNIRFIARLYGIDDEQFPRRIAEFVELTDFLNTPLVKCPKFVKPRLAFALGIGMDFDVYLFDGSLAPVDKPFKERAAELAATRTAGRAVVVATSLPAEVERNCESAYVLEAGRATYFARANEAVEHFKQLLAAENRNRQEAGGKLGEAEAADEDGWADADILGAAVADELN